jgi:hypothetical protein
MLPERDIGEVGDYERVRVSRSSGNVCSGVGKQGRCRRKWTWFARVSLADAMLRQREM